MATENTESTERVLRIQNSESRIQKLEVRSWKLEGLRLSRAWLLDSGSRLLHSLARNDFTLSLFRTVHSADPESRKKHRLRWQRSV